MNTACIHDEQAVRPIVSHFLHLYGLTSDSQRLTVRATSRFMWLQCKRWLLLEMLLSIAIIIVPAYIYLTLRRLMSYIHGAPILDVSRSHTTTQHSR